MKKEIRKRIDESYRNLLNAFKGHYITVCYATTKGIERFEINNNEIKKIPLKKPPSLKPEEIFTRKILLISKELLYYTREKYPSTSEKNIAGIIYNDISDIFPMLKEPTFQYKIFKKFKNYELVDIWAWEQPALPDDDFDKEFHYVIPEDIVFSSDNPEISVFIGADKVYTVAYSEKGFLGSMTMMTKPKANDLDFFLRSLGEYREKVVKIKNYLPEDMASPLNIPVVKLSAETYPLSMEYLQGFDLKPFQVKSLWPAFKPEAVLRGILYFVILLSFFLYLSIVGHNSSLEEVSLKIHAIDKELNPLLMSADSDDDSESEDSIKSGIHSIPSPLEAMDILAQILPENCYLTRLKINEKTLEVWLHTKEPTLTIRDLGDSDLVNNVRLKGTPNKDRSGNYRMHFLMEMN